MSEVNKINIYLIKPQKTLAQIFKDPLDDLKTIEIEGSKLYYNPKGVNVPSWVKNFFKTDFQDDERNIFNTASSQAVLIKRVALDGKELAFAITFGQGYHMLSREAYEPKFGLKIVLNVVNENNLRKIETHDISSVPKHKSEQLSKSGKQIDFSLNIETDILTGIVGNLNKHHDKDLYEIFGTNLSGKNNLNINSKFDIENIDTLLEHAYSAYKSDKYREKGFDWIDNIDVVKQSTQLYEDLNNELDNLLSDLDSENDRIWMAVPEIVQWEDISDFYYGRDKENRFDDLFLDDVRSCIPALSIQNLKNLTVNALHANEDRDAYQWKAFECLYAEIGFNNDTYILINTQWYKLNSDFVSRTNQKFETITNKPAPIQLAECTESDTNENAYNQRIASIITNAVCLDAQNIPYGGGQSKIEFCDIFDIDNGNLIHIKKYSSSQVLSHLFNQGLVSAELLLNDATFKNKVAEVVQQQSSNFSFQNLQNFNVIFGIIAKPTKEAFAIPFFSKITLNNIAAKIQNMKGYDVYVKLIPNRSRQNSAGEND